jgi:hypothetical protein
MSEMFTVGGTDVNIHKYLGPITNGGSNNATEPSYLNESAKNIQDLLFLENRDRKYDSDVYTLRSLYRINDNDFDLTQFGLFLTGDTMFMVFHLNDMIDTIGRKLMVGDVMELPHLKDYYPLDEDIPAALKRYYVVQDATKAAEGFAPTWYPHLWRIKVAPLVDSQEYKDILNIIKIDTDNDGDGDTSLSDLLSTYNKLIDINDAVIERAEDDVPASGYDTSAIYTLPVDSAGMPNVAVSSSAKVEGYLTGDGLPPNGAAVAAGIAFPSTPSVGDYCLRLDYIPNRLFRYDGRRWTKIEDAVRTNLTPGPENTTLRSGFVNNTKTLKASGNAIASDIVRAANPYVVPANAATSSFTLSTKTVVTKIIYTPSRVVESFLNRTKVSNTVANAAGNLSFTITTSVSTGDLIEYSVFESITPERQSLSNALRPTADN